MLDLKGNVSEAPGENIFTVKDGKLMTPPLSSSALEGLTRDSVIKLAEDFGYQVKESEITRGQMYLADEVFLTGTAAEITPITHIDNKKIGTGKAGKITQQIMSAYLDAVMNKNEKYSSWVTSVY